MPGRESRKQKVLFLERGGTAYEIAEQSGFLAALDFYPQSLEQIREQLPKKYRDKQMQTRLMRLCMENLAIQISPGYFCKNKS